MTIESTLAAICDRVQTAARERRPLRVRGGGTKDWLGARLDGELLEMRDHAGIVEYEPSELVVTARAGTPLEVIERALDERQQMLAFEPPRTGPAATIGGCVAAGLCGPRRFAFGPATGSVRDAVLGVRLVDGRGEVLRFGGTVMKNVAGYDVSRLIAGAFGILGVIADVSLKVIPKPMREATLRFQIDEPDALRRLDAWAGAPWPISASAWQGHSSGDGGTLHVRLSGAPAGVESAASRLGGERVDDSTAAQFWSALRDQRSAFFDAGTTPGRPLWRVALPHGVQPIAHELDVPGGDQLIEWGGAQRWLRTDRPAQAIRALAASLGGHATRWRAAPSDRADWLTPLAPAELAIHRRLKAEFDPAGILNPGRLYADL